jgi:AcrR family transcriptional regulator
MSAARRARAPLARSDWVEAGLAALGREGPGGLRIEALADRLRVTKGSFYWHFRDREDLVDAVLIAWEAPSTADIIEQVRALPGGPEVQLRALAERVVRESEPGRLLETELAVRAWASFDPVPARRVRRVDAARLAFLTELLREIGFRGLEVELRARLFYFYLLGEMSSLVKDPLKRRLRFTRRRLDLILS